MIVLRPCDVCGTLNFKENNYCIHCGNKLILEHICPVCGKNNDDLTKFCVECGCQLNPLSINDFNVLFNDFNKNLLLNAEISDFEYNQLLSKIFKRADYFEILGGTVKDMILNLAGIYTECETKSRGYERGFIFLGNCIYYDDRLEDSVQIATIIHELAHYFLFHIVETLLCDILKVRSSSTIQSFVWYFLTLPEFKIMNEYCAHTVEGRFIPHGYQNYGSFNTLVKDSDYDVDLIKSMIVLGNSFANEIIVYLEKYIDEDLREEIKLQYRKDLKSPNYDSIYYETSECLSLSVKNRFLIDLMGDVFVEVSNSETLKELESIKEGIEFD
ncbi:double zinc ribbon domain-containing protein [Methanobrevibacter sp.]